MTGADVEKLPSVLDLTTMKHRVSGRTFRLENSNSYTVQSHFYKFLERRLVRPGYCVLKYGSVSHYSHEVQDDSDQGKP